MNAVEIESAVSELALAPFDPVEFPYSFLAAFGNKDTALKRLRSGNNNASNLAGAGRNPKSSKRLLDNCAGDTTWCC